MAERRDEDGGRSGASSEGDRDRGGGGDDPASEEEFAGSLELLQPARATATEPGAPGPSQTPSQAVVVDLAASDEQEADDDDNELAPTQQQPDEEDTEEISESVGDADASASDDSPSALVSTALHAASVAPAPSAAPPLQVLARAMPPASRTGTQQQPLLVASDGDDSADLEPLSVLAPKKSRKRLRADAPVKPTIIHKAQPTECTICYDACTISGRHRLVALKCGHLFGKRCIERWVLERKTCPNCNVAVRKADIRPLFSDHVAVVDNSGLEGMKQMYEDEKSKRIQAETELSRTKLQMEILAAESKRHLDESLHWRRAFTDLQCKVASDRFTQQQQQASLPAAAAAAGVAAAVPSQPLPAAPTPARATGGGFFVPTTAPTTMTDSLGDGSESAAASSSSSVWHYTEVYRYALQSTRVFAIAPSCSLVCVGEEFSTTKFGLLKLSAVDARHAVRIPSHQSPVRDLKINAAEDLVVTVAFDGKLVVSSLTSQTVVLQCPLPQGKRQGWSCAFSDVDPFALYCGFHDGSVAKYDMRRPTADGIVESFAAQERQPVHAIRLSRGPDGTEQLIAATFSSLSRWNDCNRASDQSGISRAPDARAAVASCCSLSAVQTRPGTVVASSRTLPHAPAKHAVFDLSTDTTATLTPFATVTGHRTPPVLSRTAVWDARDGSTVVAAGDDESKRVLLWDAQTNAVRHRLSAFPRGEVVIDLQHAVARGTWRSGRALFGVLSSQALVLYSSSSSSHA